MEIILIVVSLILAIGAGFWYLGQKLNNNEKPEDKEQDKLLLMLNQQMNEMRGQMDRRLDHSAKIMERSGTAMGQRLDNAAKAISGITGKLAQLDEAIKPIHNIGKDITGLQDIFKSPKLRGNLGEESLKDLFTNLPHEMYQFQYTFKNGKKVDAVIKFQDHLVPIDSKFSLENFQKFLSAEDEKDKKAYKKAFYDDTKKRIDEAAQYIMPDEGTLDFCFLYIPAENIYYELIIRDEDQKGIDSYARKKRVILVSPNNLLAYMQIILMGLRGMQVQERTKDILKTITGLKTDFERFGDEYEKIGTHLGHATKKYDESEKRLMRLGNKFDRIELAHEEEPKPELLENA